MGMVGVPYDPGKLCIIPKLHCARDVYQANMEDDDLIMQRLSLFRRGEENHDTVDLQRGVWERDVTGIFILRVFLAARVRDGGSGVGIAGIVGEHVAQGHGQIICR